MVVDIEEKNTYKYQVVIGHKVIEKGWTYDVERREAEVCRHYGAGARMRQIGRRTTHRAAIKWLQKGGLRPYNKPKVEYSLKIISRERAEQAVPSTDCSGRAYTPDEREDIIRYVMEGAEIQRDKDVLAIGGKR